MDNLEYQTTITTASTCEPIEEHDSVSTSTSTSASTSTSYKNPMGKITKPNQNTTTLMHTDADIDRFLVNEQMTNVDEHWNKLNKPERLKRFVIYADAYSKNNNLDPNEHLSLIEFLKNCLDRKKLSKVKDIEYDRSEGVVKSIPGLIYNKSEKRFTLKNMDKKKGQSVTATLKE